MLSVGNHRSTTEGKSFSESLEIVVKIQIREIGGDRKSNAAHELPLVLGRDTSCGFRIHNVLVSRRHAEISEREGRLLIRDLGSANGTFVNGKRVFDECLLHSGDTIVLGIFIFEVKVVSPLADRILAGGEILGLIGPNGAGKTTTLKSLSCVIAPTQGRLTIDGFDVDHDPLEVKRRIAYVPDDPQLFPNLSVEQHLAFTASAYGVPAPDEKAGELLNTFELTHQRKKAARDLSRGMRQKLAICCAYLHDPLVLMFDEPLTGLDPRGIRRLKESISARAAEGAAIIVSSHLLAMVEDICTQLLIDRTVAKLRRLDRSLRNPRKVGMTIVAVLLAVLWLGNATLSLLYRDAYSIETLRIWIPAILAVYAFWHVVRVAWKRPESPIEWTAAEKHMLCTGPFTRRELLRYRLTAVFSATFFKALFASLLLFPELPIWPIGFVGLILALTFIEMLRMAFDIVAHGADRKQYLLFRIAVFALLGIVAAGVVFSTSGEFYNADATRAGSTVQVVLRSVDTLPGIIHSTEGRVLLAPFLMFSDVIIASEIATLDFFRILLTSLTLVAATGWLVIWLDRYYQNRGIRYERERFQRNPTTRAIGPSEQSGAVTLSRIRRLSGVGPVFWRQWVGICSYKGELALALVPPILLSLLPLLQPMTARATFLHVVAGIVFYSFLLLPPALKFDFRRDYERLGALKMLPLRTPAIVAGQLAAPILIVSLFQVAIMSITVAFRPVSPAMFAIAAAVLLPLNVLIFGLENLIFLLAPHRLKQEGIEVFLRTMLVFTAKSIFFGIGLVFFFVWSSLAKSLSAALAESVGLTIDSGVLFLAGSWVAIGTAAYCTVDQLSRAFRRIDPAEDIG
eukprot:g26674.t1